MNIAARIIFWVCVAAVVYAYAIYPVLICILSRCLGHRPLPPEMPEAELPTVSLLIAAHNEEAVIQQRIKNALELDYPGDRLQIVIASDGSNDRTVEIARRYSDQVRILDNPNRRGKAATLNAAMQHLSSQIVLLSDANTSIDRMALRNLIRWFADAKVGAVCGRLILTDPAGTANVDGIYWRYETFLKKCEAKLNALLGSNGAIYAIRRNAFIPIPTGTILDDFVIPLLARSRSDCSIIYDPDAIGREETPTKLRHEFQRRVRIGAGGFQAIVLLRKLLNPFQGWIAFTFFSHKLMRWLCPFFLCGAMASAGLLGVNDIFYRWTLFGQIGFYSASMSIAILPIHSRALRPLRMATMFTSMNAALLFGFFKWLSGTQRGTWQRTERAPAITQAV